MTDDRTPTTPVWRALDGPEEIADALVGLYERRGTTRYDEAVNQVEHGLQCAALALAAGAERPTVLAALLHDIGHLLLGEDDRDHDFLKTDRHHEDVGSRFLANWFSEAVTEPIRLHVPAKRYLVATDTTYHDGLSPASVRSLVVQGGPMTPGEVADFEAQPGHAEAADLRRWDDLGKTPNAPTPPMSFFCDLLVEELSAAGSAR
ncbi:MAG: HD domain-containing protein [Actinomycetota bacterium]